MNIKCAYIVGVLGVPENPTKPTNEYILLASRSVHMVKQSIHIWAIISSVMDTFLTVFVLQSKNEKTYGSNQRIPVLIYIWTKVCPIRYFGFAR